MHRPVALLVLLIILKKCKGMAMSMSASKIQRNVVWFRNDLRIHDNPTLTSIIPGVKETLCIYCFDPRQFTTTKFGCLKTGAYRAQFLIESVANLRKNLRLLGQDLLVTYGKPESCIPRLLSGSTGSNVYVQGEVTSEEMAVERNVEEQLHSVGGRLVRVVGGSTLFHPEDLPFHQNLSNLPDVFTVFREKVEKQCRVRPILPAITYGQLGSPPPSTDPLDSSGFDWLPSLSSLLPASPPSTSTPGLDGKGRGVMRFHGGEDAALQRVQHWMFASDRLQSYFEERNGMLGEGYSSKLSPWLALGCISPRYIYTSAKRYEKERNISNKSTYWLIFELIWRDFFRFFCAKYGVKVFQLGGAKEVNRAGWSSDAEKIRRWQAGLTGQPLVDANMRELLLTGWMSNRGRQNVASYLVLELGVDWRQGAAHFEELLLDHDVCSNYGNWNAAAGLTGGRLNRFNIVKQSKDYDLNGDYIKHWLPELRNVPASQLFQPWLLSADDQTRYGVTIGVDYPAPLDVDSKSSSSNGYSTNRKSESATKDSKKPNSNNTIKRYFSKATDIPPVDSDDNPPMESSSGGGSKFKRVQHF